MEELKEPREIPKTFLIDEMKLESIDNAQRFQIFSPEVATDSQKSRLITNKWKI